MLCSQSLARAGGRLLERAKLQQRLVADGARLEKEVEVEVEAVCEQGWIWGKVEV